MNLSRRSLLLAMAGATAGSAFSSQLGSAGEPDLLENGGASIQVQIASDGFDLPRTAILNWVRQSASAVRNYLGKFPVTRAVVLIMMSEGDRGVGHGSSFGVPDAWCRVNLGQHATVADLKQDWVLTHEMIHFSFPSVPRRNHWIEEGISTYVEPIARSRIGLISPNEVWSGMVRNMPKGLPASGDQGLDFTHNWGRTYWGGAMFCLLADVGIRKATGNRMGLPDALGAINGAGGNITTEWPIERAFEIADNATGGRILSNLYQLMRSSAFRTDLPDLWKQLGVASSRGQVTFDDQAPLASVREAILSNQIRPA